MNHPTQDDKATMFAAHLKEISPILDYTYEALRDIFESIQTSSETVEEAPEKVIPWFMTFTLVTVFYTAMQLSKESRHISLAIQTRAIIECMATINWLHEAANDTDELKRRARILLSQSEDLQVFTNKIVRGEERKRPKTLESRGAPSITERVKKCGSGWPDIYAHLSSYAHMDGGFLVHYLLKETDGVSNLFATEVCFAAALSLEQLADLLPLNSGAKDRAKTRSTYVADTLMKIALENESARHSGS
jgi:hypothetical protein